MKQWTYTLDLGDVFHADIPFPEKRDEMVRRIKALPIISAQLAEIADLLAAVQTPDEWDVPWDAFYDYADRNRIWVRTFGRKSVSA